MAANCIFCKVVVMQTSYPLVKMSLTLEPKSKNKHKHKILVEGSTL